MHFQSPPNAKRRAQSQSRRRMSFSGWTKTLTNPQALRRDRGPAHLQPHIIDTGIDSYRLAHTKQLQQG